MAKHAVENQKTDSRLFRNGVESIKFSKADIIFITQFGFGIVHVKPKNLK